MKIPLSVTILTKNSQKYLSEVLTPLKIFNEVLICDTGSHDETINIAKQFPNVKCINENFIGFGPTHNLASNAAQNDWILSIDSDEVLSPELAAEIFNLSLTRGCVYSFPRHNEYKGKWIHTCGWYPDRCIRLYHRQDTQFTNAQVHESIESSHLTEIQLKNPLRHYSYHEASDFLQKMQSYSTLFAQQYQGKKKSSLMKAISHSFFAFFKTYLLKKGFLSGSQGFEIAVYNANTAFYKYLKLMEANQKFKQ